MLIFITSTDDSGMSVTSGATAPAPPNLLMLKTCKADDQKIKEMNKNLDDHKQTIAWTLPFFKYWGIHYLINHLKSLTFNYIV